MRLFKNKKGYLLKDLAPLAVAFVAVAIAVSLGIQILGQMAEDQCASGYTFDGGTASCLNGTGDWVSGAGETYESNATQSGMEANVELASWLPTIALIVAAAVIIGVIVVYLAQRFT